MSTDNKSRKSLKWLLLASVLIIAGAIAYWVVEIRPNRLPYYTFYDVTVDYKVKGDMYPTSKHYITNVVKTSEYTSDEYAVRQRMAAIQQARELISQRPNVEYIKGAYAKSSNYIEYQDASKAMYELVRNLDENQARGFGQVETINLAAITDK